MQVLFLLIAFITGCVITFVFLNSKISAAGKSSEAKFIDADRQCGILNDRLQQVSLQMRSVDELLTKERTLSMQLNSSLAEQKTIADGLREKMQTQKSEMEQLHQKFTTEFENLSGKILEEKSKKFTEQNRINLDIILNPLKEKIKDFEQKVDQSYKAEAAERNSLKGEIKNLIELNKQISDEANNLAKALKGDSKKQGNWGEIILERILERSGLTRGSEYELQFSTSNDDGRRIQPDVIVNLPDKKHIIIDSKVSLVAYDAMVNSEDDALREKFLRDHLSSVRSHIKLLSDKNYYSSKDLSTPEFVLIFMPIEPALSCALQADNELFYYAFDSKIVLVSPSTLLATLRTISSIWKQEKQNKNAQEIARVGGALYDKFANFLKDMSTIGDKLKSAQESHDDAMNKLVSGSGNIMKRVEELKKLGAKNNKEIPQTLIEKAEESDAEEN